MVSRFLYYILSIHVTPMQQVRDLYANSCKVADFFNESTLNNIFIKCAHPSYCHSLREYWATRPREGVPDLAFPVQTLLENKKGDLSGQQQQSSCIQQTIWKANMEQAIRLYNENRIFNVTNNLIPAPHCIKTPKYANWEKTVSQRPSSFHIQTLILLVKSFNIHKLGCTNTAV